MRKPGFIKIFLLRFACCWLLANGAGFSSANATGTILMDKITFRVDTRDITASPTGMFIAGNFFDQIGEVNWSLLPMCDLGSGIWEISFTGIAPGTYQYKFVNGNAPPFWEFNGYGGPCTNPADNENRWLNYGGGIQVEGPWCFGSCDLFCPGYSDPGVSDTNPPTIDEPAPPNTTVICGDPLPTATALAASDECDANATTTTGLPTDDMSGLDPCGLGDVIRTWEVADCAGNTATATQTITITDNDPPSIDTAVPADVTVECGNLPAAISLAASDVCDADVTTTGLPTDDNSSLNACGIGEVLRTWEVTDCAGNTIAASQTITLEDSTAPTIDGAVPADVTISCGSVPGAVSLDASDACDAGVTTTGMPTDDNSGLNACGVGEIIRTWETTDCSGNSVSASQTITVEDDEAPVLTAAVPAAVTVNCGSIPTAAALDVSDTCDSGVTSTGMPIDDSSGLNACGIGEIIRTWEVADCSGNIFSDSQTITVEDNDGPTIDEPVPPNITIECGDPLQVGQPLMASDVCDVNVSTTGVPTDDFSNIGSCGTGQVSRTWEVTDCSGNTTTDIQIITIIDTSEPIITESVPPNTIVTCSGIPLGAPLNAIDACDGNVVSTNIPNDDFSNLNNCGLGVVIRTWTATDCAGNSATGVQLITIEDIVQPIITEAIPADVTVSCGNVPTASPLSATDDCDGSVVTTGLPTDDLGGLNNCGVGVILRTWTAMDCSGNSVFGTQAIAVTDDEPPVLSIPADASLDCNSIPTASAADATATDNCSMPTITYDGEIIIGNGCPYEIHRTWSATDECGNMVSATQIITVTDLEAPVFAMPPANVNVCVGDVPASVDLDWTDNCDGTGSVSPTDVSDGMTNPETITRTWTYTDNCGNASSVSQIIIIEQPPAANAGADQNLCNGLVASLSGNVSGGFNSLLWTSNGDGSFQNATNQNTEYTPGTNDLTNGTVSIYFTAQTTGACSETSDSLVLTFLALPLANAGDDQTITCEFPNVTLDGSGSSSGIGYSFEWSGPGINAGNMNDQNPEVALPGNYFIIVTDTTSGQSCMATDSVEIFEDITEPTADAGADMVLTCTQTSVTLDGSGSSPGAGFEYLWTGPGITAANENLPNPSISEGGIYILIITNTLNGCTASDESEVTLDGNLPIADAGPNQTINCDISSVTLDGSNSSSGSGIEYQWFDPNGQPMGNVLMQTVSVGGIYSLNVNDTNNGCEITATVEVVVDTILPVADAGQDKTITCGQPSVVLGGNSSMGAEFEYEWTFGLAVIGNDEMLTASQLGIYTLNILDTENGCSASDEIEVFQNADLPTAEAGIDQQLDCGNTTVTLDGTGSSNGANILIEWAGPSFTSNEISPQVSSVGIYYLTVTDTLSGCSAVDSVQVTTDADLPIAIAGADTTLTCFAPQVLLDASSSTQGNEIEYEWLDETGMLLGNDFTLLLDEPGTYTLNVSNTQSGCVGTDEITIGLDTLSPIANAGMDMQFTCTQTTLTLDGTGSTTGQNINYLWTGPGIVGDSAALMAQVVEVGTYLFTITDIVNGCSATDEVIISQNPDVPTAFTGADQAITCLVSSVILNGSASVNPADYLWSGPDINASNVSEQNPTVIEPGIYTLIVTDPATGCDSPPALVTVFDEQNPPAVAVLVNGDLDCLTTSVLLDGSNSAQGDTIIYTWYFENQPLPSSDDDEWMASGAGTYVLEVFNEVTGCTGFDSVAVVDNSDLPPVEINGFGSLNCFDEIITLTEVAGSTLPNASFVWSTIGGNILQENQNEITVDAGGQYIVEVTDLSNSCVNTDIVFINEDFEMPVIVFITDFTIGCSQSEVMLEVDVTANSNDLLYAWSGNGFSSNETMPSVMQPGQYDLIVTNNENGCSAMETTTVTLSSGVEDVFITTTPPTCFGGADGILQVDSVAGFNPPYSYFLENGNPTGNPLFTGLSGGIYTLLVTDSAGCEMELNFTLNEPSILGVDLGADQEINLGEIVQLSPIITAPVSQYVWENDATLSCDDCPEPIAQPTETTLYSLTVSSEDGCEAMDDILISVNSKVDIFAPNVFSPNGDGINDTFTLFAGTQVSTIKTLLVFDRWGGHVFEDNNLLPGDLNHGWDGTQRGQLMDVGIYVFYAELELTNGELLKMEGEVTLIR